MNWIEILATVSTVIAIASGVANLTPNDRDNRWVSIFANAVDFLALNFNVQKGGTAKEISELFMQKASLRVSNNKILEEIDGTLSTEDDLGSR